jgi:uncharacterized protein
MKKLILAGLFCLPYFLITAQTFENIPLLTVTGEATVKAIPDQAVIVVRVQRRVEISSLTTVSDAFLFSKEQTDIKFIGNDDSEILTSVMEAHLNDKSALFIKEFIITVNNLQNLTKVLMELLRHDFTNIYYISYRLSNINVLKDAARKEAVKNAHTTAMLYAREFGQGLGKAHLITEQETPINNWYIEKQRPDLNELIGTTYRFNPGYITIPCKVTVSFNLL